MDGTDKPFSRRFKGVENFFRRISYNLGNNPSETEVKIISCIPIDVTDLQEKILHLERQLEQQRQKSGNSDNLNKSKDLLCTVKSTNQVVLETRYAEIESQGTPFTDNVERRSSKFSFMTDKSSLGTNDYKSKNNKRKPKFIDCLNVVKNQPINTVVKKPDSRLIQQNKIHAHTKKIPLTHKHVDDKVSNGGKENLKMDRDYITTLIEKQYKLETMPSKTITKSQVSSPIIKDIPSINYEPYKPCCREFSSCSYLSKRYYNTDYVLNHGNMTMRQLNDFRLQGKYGNLNDLSLYDIVKKPIDHANKGDQNNILTKMQLYPENIERIDTNYQVNIPFDIPYRKYNRLIQKQRNVCESAKQKSTIHCKRKSPVKHSNYSSVKITHQPKIKASTCSTPVTNQTTVYNNTHIATLRKQQANRNYVTLHQVKAMLQPIFKEVKENSQLKKSRQFQRKDAILQAGISQIRKPTSTILNEFSFNSPSMYLRESPCLGQGIKNHLLCSPNLTLPYLQNYPLLFYLPNSSIDCNKDRKQKAAATNTDKIENQQKQCTESERLIKDIFQWKDNNIKLKDKFNKNADRKQQPVSDFNDIKKDFKHEPEDETNVMLPKAATDVKIHNVKENAEISKVTVVSNITSVGTNVSETSAKCCGEGDCKVKSRIETQTESDKNLWVITVANNTSDTCSDFLTISNGNAVYKVKEKSGLLNKIKNLIPMLPKTNKRTFETEPEKDTNGTLTKAASDVKIHNVNENTEILKVTVVSTETSAKCCGEGDYKVKSRKETQTQTDSDENLWVIKVANNSSATCSDFMTISNETDAVNKVPGKGGLFNKMMKLIPKLLKTNKRKFEIDEDNERNLVAYYEEIPDNSLKKSSKVVILQKRPRKTKGTMEQEGKRLWYESFQANKNHTKSSESTQRNNLNRKRYLIYDQDKKANCPASTTCVSREPLEAG